MAGGRTGRRPGLSGTRDDILRAAREEFAARGFRGATLRAIASRAGVDTALIRHFFGRKDTLFRAALDLPETTSRLIQAVAITSSDPGAGERLARTYLALWEDPLTRSVMQSMLASAVGHPDAQALLARDFAAMVAEAVSHTSKDMPELRLTLAFSHLAGVAIARHISKAASLTALDLDSLVALVAPAIQQYLMGPLPGAR